MLLLLYAHPHHARSVANRVLLEAVRDLPDVRVHALYDSYPDFAIDVAHEQALLRQARAVVWQHPLYWYTVPALLKLWFEMVLTRGWAYGEGGTALAGKRCLWASTTGAPTEGYTAQGVHQHPFAQFTTVVEQTARFCGMHWETPFVLHGAHRVDGPVLLEQARQYRARLASLLEAG